MGLIFSLIFGLTTVLADDYLPAEPNVSHPRACTSLRLNRKLPPLRTQGDAGFCFSYTAANLIHQRTGIDASALDLAQGFYFGHPGGLRKMNDRAALEYLIAHPLMESEVERDRHRTGVDIEDKHPYFHKLSGGFETSTLLNANTRGICEDEDFPSHEGFAKFDPVIARMQKRAEKHNGIIGREVDAITSRFRDIEADLFHTQWFRLIEKSCYRVFPDVALIPVMLEIADGSAELIKKMANGELKPADQDPLFSSLDYALENDRIVAIGYDLNTLMVSPEDDGDHSATVIGRRWRQGECEYMIRDTSGYECSEYIGSIAKTCSNHQYWMTESQLRQSFYSIVYLR